MIDLEKYRDDLQYFNIDGLLSELSACVAWSANHKVMDPRWYPALGELRSRLHKIRAAQNAWEGKPYERPWK